jgi:hypothetical protein
LAFENKRTFNSSGSRKRPAGSATALVLDTGDFAFALPVLTRGHITYIDQIVLLLDFFM